MTSPAPSRPRPEAEPAEPELRTDTDRLDAAPGRERDSRPDTERRDEDEREEREERADADDERPEPRESPCRAALVMPVGGDSSSSAPAATAPIGASPQVSQ
ncbi:hypothetical protein [Streptomyces sp. NPDC054838]